MKLIKNANSKYFLLPGLTRKQMGLLKRKKNENGKSMFPNSIGRLGRKNKKQNNSKKKKKKKRRKNQGKNKQIKNANNST